VGALAARSREAIGDSEWTRQQEAGGRLSLTDALVEGSALTNSVQ
jgi:hypothetical protein